MKKSIFTGLFILMLLAINAKSQTTIADPGFEDWINDHTSTSWSFSNISSTYLGIAVTITPVTKSTDCHGGSFSANLISKDTTILGVYTTPVNPGIATVGTFWFDGTAQTGGVKGGIPFSGRPDSLTFYYKSSLQGNDATSVFYEAWQGDHTVTIADDSVKIPVSAADWTYFAMPINYLDAGTPDSMNLTISSSDVQVQSNIAANSQLTIDDISLVYGGAGIIDVVFSENFNVYADEIGDHLIINLTFDKSQPTEIYLYDISGHLITANTKNIKVSKEIIDLYSLAKGIYVVKVIRTEDGKSFSQKISVNR